MRIIKTWVPMLLFAVTANFVACTSHSGQKAESALSENAGQFLTVDDVLIQNGVKPGDRVKLEGVCTHICSHGGRKIFLMGSDDTQTIRIEATTEIGKFGQNTVNNIVRVEGKLVEDRIDENYLTAWEERLRQQTEEKHGKAGENGCSSEQKARGENQVSTPQQRIDNFRTRIAKRHEKEGKDYLSFYHIEATSYEVQ